MSSRQPEGRLVEKILEALRGYGGWWVKYHGSGYTRRGIPDILGVLDGFFFALEVKLPGEEPSTIQEVVMEQIRRGGGTAAVVRSPEEALKVVMNG